MRIIKYRFTNPLDGAEHGGICTTLKEAEKVTKAVTNITGPWWSRNAKFEWEVLTFDRKTQTLMDALYMAMKFAHDVHEIAPKASDVTVVKKPIPEQLRVAGGWRRA